MFFLTFSNVNMLFAEQKLTWSSYTLTEALSIIKQVQIICHKELVVAPLDLSKKTFVVYIVSLSLSLKFSIYLT